jgi:hypothetical protein
MVITPAIRGLFGISVDAEHHTLTVAPHLPADWDHATLRHLSVGIEFTDVEFRREGNTMLVSSSNSNVKLAGAKNGALRIPLPPVEVSIPHTLPLPGAETQQLKVLSQKENAHSLTLELEAQGGSMYDLPLRLNGLRGTPHAEGATISLPESHSTIGSLHIVFPADAGYQKQTVQITW